MSISTLANLEGRHVFTEVLSGRELGEGPYTDVQVRAGGQGDDTRKISLQVNDGQNYVEQASVTKRGLNIESLVIRDSIVFDRGDGTSKDQYACRIATRREPALAEIAFELGGNGPGKGASFTSEAGAQFAMPAHFQGVLRARDLRVHGMGAVFTHDGADAAYVRVREGALTFDGAHCGRADLDHARLYKAVVDDEIVARDCARVVFSTSKDGHPSWTMRAYDHTHGLAIESTFRDAPLYVNDGDPSGESAFEVRNGDVIARKTLRGRCLNVRTARVHEHLYAQQIEGASANFAGITAHDISAMHVNADGVETRALIAQQAYVDELHVHHETRTRVLRVDETVVARDVHATNVAATDTVAASIVQGTHVIAETLSAPRQGVLHVTSDLVVHEKASVGSLVARDVIEVLGNARNMRMFEGEIYINNQRTISLNEGRVHAPLVTTAQLMADRIISSLVRLHTLEAGGGHDTGDIDVRARGLTLGNVRIDGDAFIEVVGSDDHNGILEFIAKNGVLMRSGDEELGSFEPPLWQVIKGQGVRQTGSLYMITPGTGRYVKLEPPSTTNEVFSVYVNTQGQSIIALETDPEQTRIPLKLLVGSSLVDEGCGDGSGTSTPSAALQVRSASTYGGPTAVFHVTNPCADAEIKIKAESNTSILSLETATGHVRVEHRSEANELAFFNDETGNDFLVVDTVTGLARVTGDLVVGGSLYFGAATETTSNNGNGQISFDQGLSVTSGLLDLGNVELRAMGNTGRILEISASSVNSPILFAPSFAITEPPNGSSQRQFAFNAYVDQIGAVRHIDNGSSAVLSHTVRQPGELAPSSLKLGFSPRTILADSFADVDTAFEANDDGEISLTNGDDFGRVEIKQDRILQQVKFETTRASYSFDQTAEVVGDVRVKQVSDTARYHSLRSTDEGLYVQGTPSFTANTELALTSAIILGDGYPDGVRWRMRVSPSTGELVFEHQHGPGDAWSSKFRMISGV